jgi:hypothetical protein
MPRTGDRTLGETLKKIHSFSVMDKDRKEAERALDELGVSTNE